MKSSRSILAVAIVAVLSFGSAFAHGDKDKACSKEKGDKSCCTVKSSSSAKAKKSSSEKNLEITKK
jgi:hypothetical protein